MTEKPSLKDVPVINVPKEDDIDDAASKEAAALEDGTLSVCVMGSRRSMEAYTITATELKGLSIWSVVENRAYNVASGSGSFAIGLLSQALFTNFEELPPLAQATCYIGIPFGLAIAIISFLVGKYISSQKDGLEKSIKDETSHDNSQGRTKRP